MRNLLSLSAVAFLALTVGACQDRPTAVDREQPEVSASQGATDVSLANHDDNGATQASGVYRAVNSTAAKNHGLRGGEKVGTLHVTDDGSDLTITGEASGLVADDDQRYVSLFYDKASSVQGPRACEPGQNVGFAPESDHPLALTLLQMVIGPGTNPDVTPPTAPGPPHAAWDVDGNGDATFGPSGTYQYVPVDKVGSASIRDTEVNGPFGPGTGPEAVVACAQITHDPPQ